MHTLFRRFGLVFVLVLCLVGAQLPAVTAPVSSRAGSVVPAVPLAIARGLARLNYWRAQLHEVPLRLDPRLQRAAMLFAQYRARYPVCLQLGCHAELKGTIGFTGVWPYDRCAAAGYRWPCGDEDLDFSSPLASVDGLVITVVHRADLLDPLARYVGIGDVRGSNGVEYVPIHLGMGAERAVAPAWWTFPASGQRNVPVAYGGEGPSPLPVGARGPNGDPITITFGSGYFVSGAGEVRGLTLRRVVKGVAGAPIPLYFLPAHNSVFWNHVAAGIPRRPLCPRSAYLVQAVLSVHSTMVPVQWRFSTAAKGIATARCQ